jgi:protein-tyrosine phosphatase
VLAAGITAIVDLASNELPVAVTRELAYCRFPLVDAAANEDWLLRGAIETTASFLRSGEPTLVCCGAGMSRAPAIVAAALALVDGSSPQDRLTFVARSGACDVSPYFWEQVSRLVRPS